MGVVLSSHPVTHQVVWTWAEILLQRENESQKPCVNRQLHFALKWKCLLLVLVAGGQ